MVSRLVELELGDDERAFLQRRVSFYALISFGIVCSFILLDMTGWLLLSSMVNVEQHRSQQILGAVTELGAALVLLGSALVTRRGQWGVMQLFIFDALITLACCTAFSLQIYQAPTLPFSLEMMVFLAIQSLLFVHATVVPAPAPRTFVVHTLACVPLFIVALQRARAIVTDDPLEQWAIPVGIGLWGLIFAVIGTILTRMLFRLRLRIKKAMRLGQYRLEQKLGEGGMGVVYRASHALLRRPTAIKLLPKHKVGEKDTLRFEREVRNTSRLSHPNTVAIYDYGRTPEGIFYYAMELLEGPNLAQVVEMTGPLPASRVIHILMQCAGALEEAHEMGLVHRDVKPENIVLCRRGGVPDVVKVVDFGLVKDLAQEDDVKLSRTDALTGTPLYIAPEAITAPEKLDGRADLYALGAVGWFLLVGDPPFEGSTALEVCAKHLETPAEPPSRRSKGVPLDLEAIVLKLLAKKPEDRYQRASEVETALRACAQAGVWTREEAEAWWSENQMAVSRVTHPQDASVLTLEIERS